MKWRKWFAPLYLWALPHTLLGLLLCLYYRPHSWRWNQGCLECIPRTTLIGGKRVGAQTWGWLIFYRDEEMMARDPLRVHERVHVVQALIGGPLFPIAYGLHFLWLWALWGNEWEISYRRVWAEVIAYQIEAEFERGERPGAWGEIIRVDTTGPKTRDVHNTI
jgi:hypothetical protein